MSIMTDGQPAQLSEEGSLIIRPGGRVDIEGSGYRPGTQIDFWFYSTPTRLGTLTADAEGKFSAHFTIPKSAPVGQHTIKIDGISKSGKLTTVSVGVLVVADDSAATTGANDAANAGSDSGSGFTAQKVAVLGGMAVMLLFVAAGIFVTARRRRRD